jgi:hypothetical protein
MSWSTKADGAGFLQKEVGWHSEFCVSQKLPHPLEGSPFIPAAPRMDEATTGCTVMARSTDNWLELSYWKSQCSALSPVPSNLSTSDMGGDKESKGDVDIIGWVQLAAIQLIYAWYLKSSEVKWLKDYFLFLPVNSLLAPETNMIRTLYSIQCHLLGFCHS